MADALLNFSYSTVATAPSPALSGTSLVVATGDGVKFAVGNAVIWPSTAAPLKANAEIVRITAIATDTLTITRAQEGTTAQSILVGFQIQQGVTAGVLAQYAAISGATYTGPIIGPLEDKGGQVYNVKAYGAKGDGVTDDTTAIQAAITAAEVVSGLVLIPAGKYVVSAALNVTSPVGLLGVGQDAVTLKATAGVTGNLLNINLVSAGKVSVDGGLTIDMALAGSAAVAVSVNNLANVYAFNAVMVQNNQAVGFTITNSNNVHFNRCSVVDGGIGVYINADNAAELIWTELEITKTAVSTMTAAIQIARTTTTDVGGHYFSLLRITRAAGTINNGILCTNSAGSVDFSPLFIRSSVIDNINGSGSAISVQLKKNVMIQGTWATNASTNANPVIVFNGCQQASMTAGCFVLAGATAIGVDLQNACRNVLLDGVTLDGGSYGIGALVGTAPSGVTLGMVLITSANVTNSSSRIGSGASGTHTNGLGVITSGASGSSQCFGIVDGAGGGNKWFRMDGSSNLQVLSSAFSGVIMQLSDTGLLSINGGTNTASSTAVSSPTPTSGTAFTPSATKDSLVYFQVNATVAGSYTLTMGPTTGAENTIGSAVAMVVGSDDVVTLRVPANWKVVLTLTNVTLARTTVVTC